jgi:hypothetical protein
MSEQITNMECVGFIRVRNMSNNTDVVCMVFKDHNEKVVRLVRGGTDEDINLTEIPPYSEKEHKSLWERISLYKNRNRKPERRSRSNYSVGSRFRRPSARWKTTATAPSNLPPMPVRQRSTVVDKSKVMSKSQIKSLMREAMGDLLEE